MAARVALERSLQKQATSGGREGPSGKKKETPFLIGSAGEKTTRPVLTLLERWKPVRILQ